MNGKISVDEYGVALIPKSKVFVHNGKLHPSSTFSLLCEVKTDSVQPIVRIEMPGWSKDEFLELRIQNIGPKALNAKLDFLEEIWPVLDIEDTGLQEILAQRIYIRVLIRHLRLLHFDLMWDPDGEPCKAWGICRLQLGDQLSPCIEVLPSEECAVKLSSAFADLPKKKGAPA